MLDVKWLTFIFIGHRIFTRFYSFNKQLIEYIYYRSGHASLVYIHSNYKQIDWVITLKSTTHVSLIALISCHDPSRLPLELILYSRTTTSCPGVVPHLLLRRIHRNCQYSLQQPWYTQSPKLLLFKYISSEICALSTTLILSTDSSIMPLHRQTQFPHRNSFYNKELEMLHQFFIHININISITWHNY